MLDTHLFGSIDLTDEGKYVCLQAQQGWDPKRDTRTVPLRGTDGAERVYSRLGETGRTLDIIVVGTGRGDAETLAQALEDTALIANTTRNVVSYQIKDADGALDAWKCIRAEWKPYDELRPTGLVIKGQLVMGLSKH